MYLNKQDSENFETWISKIRAHNEILNNKNVAAG